MDDVWAELKAVLVELHDDLSRPLQAYPDPRVEHDRHPPFAIHLQPWAVDVAGRLHERFGQDVELTVGALAYPNPTAGRLPTGRAVPEAAGDVLIAALAEPLTVQAGRSARTTLAVTNTGAADLALRTTGQLVGRVLDPTTLAVVGGCAGAMRLPIRLFQVPSGEKAAVPLLVGTASFVPELGYAIPPGEWAVAADLDLGGGEVVRTAPMPFTVT
ncbi:MAG: hypothetical protein KGJ77_06730 [Acidobacteriota bacterium]|nr:hypothetical protein [Acidobacteriota bacterium]